MKHLTEEELIESFYGENEGGAARGKHLKSCAACAQAYAALQGDLAGASAEPPARDASYGEQVWQSIAPLLPVYTARKRSWLRLGLWQGLGYAAACALLVIGGFSAGRLWEHRQSRPAVATAAPPQAKQKVVVVVLSDHLDRSERLLVELKHADAENAEMVSPLRDEARNLLAENRLCRQDASRGDDPALATALEHLDLLLAGLADQPGGLNAAAITRLQDEMKSDNLLFEVRVLRSRIPDQQGGETSRSNGGTI